MNSKYQYRFILLDFGHPMNASTIRNIKKSLENILFLSLAFSENANETHFKITILNSDFAIIHYEPSLRRNYDLVVKNLKEFLKINNRRVTVQNFKNLLSSSIDAILCELQSKFKGGEILSGQMIQIALVSKKNAWTLADILASVTSKQQKLSVENFKVVQIINEAQQKKEETTALAESIFCSDNLRDLSMFFKDWLLNLKQQLRILISKGANLEMKCEVEDCVVNPTTFCSDFNLFGGIWTKKRNFLFGTSTQVCKLEIINRLPLNGLCPTLVFGTPRRVKAIRWTESQINLRMFKQLCRELNRKGEGLLAKSALPNDLITYHFLTSDGDMILMNDVASDELHFPRREEFSNRVEFCENECDVSVVNDCLQKIKLLDEFKPENFSSGINEFLRHYFNQMKQKKSSSAYIVTHITKKNSQSKESPTNDNENPKDDRRKRRKLSPEKELKSVHPALLSPKVVEKYRKINKNVFYLPELGVEFM